MSCDDNESLDAPPWHRHDMQLLEGGLCPQKVWVDTKDGRAARHCMAPISDPELAACDDHAAQRRQQMQRRD